MATQTTNLGLTKPGYDEAADVVPAVNNNMDTLDAKIGAVPANSSVQGQLDSHTQAIDALNGNVNKILHFQDTFTFVNLDQLKAHIISRIAEASDYSAITDQVTCSNSAGIPPFLNISRYAGYIKKISSSMFYGNYQSKNGDMVLFACSNATTTPEWHFDSVVLNSKITPVIIGSVGTLSAAESAIQSIASTLGEGEQKNFTISFSSSFAPFNLSGGFSGRVTNRQVGGASWIAEIFNQLGVGNWHLGFCNGGTVTWKKLSMT